MATTTTNTRANVPARSTNAAHVAPKSIPLLRTIEDAEKFSPTVKHLDAGRLEVRFAVRPDENSKQRFECVTVFDFRTASPAEVQALAVRACVIETQRKWRTAARTNLGDARKSAQWSTVDVKSDIVDAARKSADPVAKAWSALGKLSTDDAIATLAKAIGIDPEVLKKLQASK